MNAQTSLTLVPILANISLPGSKEMTERAIIIAALAEGVSELCELHISDDLEILFSALRQLGFIIQFDKNARSVIIAGASGNFPRQEATLDFHKNKIDATFLLAAASAMIGKYQLIIDASMTAELLPLVQILTRLGAKIAVPTSSESAFIVESADGLKGGEAELEIDEQGLIISALLLVAPLAKKSLSLDTKDILNEPVIEMTCEIMADFNVLVRRMHSGRYSIPVPQRYTARDYVIEPDLKIAAIFFAAAAVTGGQITIQNVHRAEAKQSEIAFLNVLEKMGCTVTENDAGLTVTAPTELKGVNVDMHHFPQIFMALAAIAPFATTPTTITNLLRKEKEINAMYTELKKLQCKVEKGVDWLKIYPSDLTPAVLESYRNPNMAMALSILRLRIPKINIDNLECIQQVYPEFFTVWNSLV